MANARDLDVSGGFSTQESWLTKGGRFTNVKTPIAPHLPASNLTLPAKRLIPNVKGQDVMDGWTCRGMSYRRFSFIANDSDVFLGLDTSPLSIVPVTTF